MQQSLAKADAGKLARERIARLSDELRELHPRRQQDPHRDPEQQGRPDFDAEARGEQISGDHKTEPIIVDDEHFLWKFNGEYWKDELGYYRFKNPV